MPAYSEPTHRLLDHLVEAIRDNTRAQERQALALEQLVNRLDRLTYDHPGSSTAALQTTRIE